MTSQYRTYDCSPNIIFTSKTSSYKPYKALKQKSAQDQKKVQPLHLKIFDRSKKNQRILSRNDRMDLFLEGGNFSEIRHISAKSQIDRRFYKLSRGKIKQERFLPFTSQSRETGWNTASQTQYTENGNMLKSDYLNFIYTSNKTQKIQLMAQDHKEESFIFEAKQGFQKMKEPKNEEGLEIKSETEIQVREKTQQAPNRLQECKTNYKRTTQKTVIKKQISNSENHLKRVSKLGRPMFYLQPKEISHIRANSFIVTEYPSGQIIFGSYIKKTGQIASLTKIMTFYTVFIIAQNYVRDLFQEVVEIDEEAECMTGTSAQIFVGDVYTVEQLLYGLMLPSGNDAATALAKWGGQVLQKNDPTYKSESKGTEVKTFIRYMNTLAKKIGMKNSRFCNPHGLPHPQSCSNSQDLSTLMLQCLKIDLFRQVIKKKKYTCWVPHNGVKHQVIWENTNKLLRRPNFIGGKTGVTVTAGPCLISCYQYEDRIWIIVLLRTSKLSRRFKETRYLVGLALSKLDKLAFKQKIKEVLKNDPQLDSDNSDDQMQFNYQRTDAGEMAKRNKILTFEM